tara:strand:- start:5096 stop:6712 length:1617 start_codon:yes stop_codon:yes gene_type:complete
MKKVVIYPGRFQPMLPHHAKVYSQLQAQFPEAEVYISTSDKVEPGKSPFNFKEKAEIMAQMHNIPMDKIIQAKSPYLVDSYAKSFDQENTMVIFAVGAKDEDRFPMKNVDSETGLDMTVRGEARPKYYQMINTLKQHPALPMSERGYVYNAPTVKSDNDEVASASAFRNAFVNAPDEGSRQEIFNKYMGAFDNNIYALFTNKLLDKKMKEDIYNIDVMKFLAGQLNEAPVDFGDDDEDEYKPGFTQDNMINQLGKVIDSDDASKDVDAMKIKKFTPVTKVTTDDGAEVEVKPAEAKALKDMFNMLSSARQGEEESARERFQKLIQTSQGLDNMLNFAREKGLVKEETLGNDIPQIDLSDIKAEYGVEEEAKKNCGCGQDPCITYGKQDVDEAGCTPAHRKANKKKKEAVDERAECHSKDHDCATLVIHPTWGEGKPVYESHAVPTDEGYVAWYDVEFEHGIEREVPAEDMEIITLAEHGGSSLKASNFKPHMMFHPETGESEKAEKPEDHERLKKKGYTHEKPKKVKEMEELKKLAGL